MKRSTIATTALLGLLLVSCTTYQAYQKGQQLSEQKNWDEAVAQYQKALDTNPSNVKYQMALENAKLEASRVHFAKGQQLRAAGQNQLAAMEFELTTQLDPTNQYAAVELGKAIASMKKANKASENSYAEMKKRADEKSRPPMLSPSSNEPISLSFPKETNVKDIYRALGNAFGINVMFDQRLKDDKISIELRDVTAQQALERVMQAAGHFYKVLDPHTIIVVPDTPQTRREYEDLVIRTFYLSNGDAEQVTNVVRTMIEARNVFPLKSLNAITIRDTADKVRIAEKIIEANDKAKAEVVVGVELLQVDEQKLRNLGMSIATGSTGLILHGSLVDSTGAAITGLTPSDVKNLNWDNLSFTVPSVEYGLAKSLSEATTLARPQLRISEGEKATLHIGKRIPVAVTTFTAANVNQGSTYAPATTYQYQDVGIKISIEPRVHHNREVTLKLTIEVSDVVPGAGTATQPTISTRSIESTIRLKDGETNFLAGLIQQNDSTGESEVPFLGDLPLIGRLFKREDKSHIKTDLVLTMTPHIIRIPDITEEDLAPMWVGTSSNLTFRGASPRIESRTSGDPFNTPAPPNENKQFQHETGAQPWQKQQKQRTEEPPVYIPKASGPSNPFQQPAPAPQKPSEPDQGSPNGSASMSATPKSTIVPASSTTAEAAGPDYRMGVAPRIAPQPESLSLAPGEEHVWSVIGMDLAGLETPSISFHYNPSAINVEDVSIGTAVAVNPEMPPVVTVDRETGTIKVSSSDGTPIRFLNGGEILAIRIRGTASGQSDLVVDPMTIVNGQGQAVQAAVAGGHATVK